VFTPRVPQGEGSTAKALTAAGVAKLRAGKSRREISDGTSGLRLVIQPSGVKSWAIRFRRPNGKSAKLTLGSCDDNGSEGAQEPVIGGYLSLAAARRLAAETRRQLALGRDPAAAYLAERQRARVAAIETSANTFSAAARDFVEQHARKKVRRWKEQARLLGLQPADLTLIPKGLAERWRDRPVAEIDGHDIHAIVDETRRLGAPGLERRSDGVTESRGRAMFAVLSILFRWLVQHRRIDRNPCAEVHRPAAATARDRVLNDTEIRKLWAAADSVGEPFGPLLKLLLLTGCRLNEVAGMRRTELSEDGRTWDIPGLRSKNRRPHRVVLAPLAQELIAGMTGKSELVFTTNGRTPVSGWSKLKKRLDAAMRIPAWRLHDLRRTTATGMAEIGIPPHIVEAALNHISGAKAGVAGTYNRAAYLPERKAALERWATHIAGLIEGKPADVVSLRKQRRR
jgi:integrase